MKLLRGGLDSFTALSEGSVASVGNFDGVHLGHQALLKTLKAHASQRRLPLAVLLFEPQPGEFFKGLEAPARLNSLREKLDMLERCQVDMVFCLRFNQHLASMPARTFAEKYIFSLLKARFLLIGQDFRFGKGRLGDIHLLQELAKARNCQVEAFADFLMDERVSSTSIRNALKQGNLDRAQLLLGRPYGICGRVVTGDGRGSVWGVPTANIALHRKNIPMSGVFCVEVKVPGQTKLLPGVANLGRRPTVGGTKNILEIHIFDYNNQLYGSMLQVNFLRKLRDEVKFNSLSDLIDQIHRDVATAKQLLLSN